MIFVPVRAPFTLSEAAIRQIEWLRTHYLDAFPDDPSAMPGVSSGYRLFDDGSKGPKRVIIGFWRASEFPPEAHEEVQRVSGVDLVFKAPLEDVPAFAGKQMDFAEDQGFYLRPATP